jgi:hypothetical protein
MVVYVLMFQLVSGAQFLGGEYQSIDSCERGALQQLDHWRRLYGRTITWRCERRPQHA